MPKLGGEKKKKQKVFFIHSFSESGGKKSTTKAEVVVWDQRNAKRRSSSVFSKLCSTTVSTLWCGTTAPLRRQTFDMWACLKHRSCGKCDYKRAKPKTVCCSMQLVRWQKSSHTYQRENMLAFFDIGALNIHSAPWLVQTLGFSLAVVWLCVGWKEIGIFFVYLNLISTCCMYVINQFESNAFHSTILRN